MTGITRREIYQAVVPTANTKSPDPTFSNWLDDNKRDALRYKVGGCIDDGSGRSVISCHDSFTNFLLVKYKKGGDE